MIQEQRDKLIRFITRVRAMRTLQVQASTAKAAGEHSAALSKWNESIHYCKLIDETISEANAICLAMDQTELYDSSKPKE